MTNGRNERTPDLWSALSTFDDVLREARHRGASVPETYGSPVYLGQYLHAHSLITQELDRLRVTRSTRPLVVDWGAGVGHCGYIRQRLGDRVVFHALSDPEASPYISVLEHVADICDIELRATTEPIALPFSDGEVDVFVSCGVLEHVHEGGGSVDASLDEIHRVLRPGGAFVCAHLPRRGSWIEWLNRRTGRSHHDRTFRRSEVLDLHRPGKLELFGVPEVYGVVPRIQVARRLQLAGKDSVANGRRFEKWDVAATALAAPVAQNFGFVMRKPL